MFELLFLIGLIGLGLVQLGEVLAASPSFASLLVLFLTAPLAYLIEYTRLRARLKSKVLASARPLPPERFYWDAERPRILRQIVVLPVVAVFGWTLVLMYPSTSFVNWIGTALAIAGTSPTFARISLYLSVSQHFSRMKPDIIGWMRRLMVKFSDNPDYYDNEPEADAPRKPLIY